MSDDLKQRLAVLAARIEMCDKLTWGEDSAAMKDALARIEELEAKLEAHIAARRNGLKLLLWAFKRNMSVEKAKLAKAVSALERIASGEFAWMVLASMPPRDAGAYFANTILAELKGDKNELD